MFKTIHRQESRFAILGKWLGFIGIPLMLIGFLLHRLQIVTSSSFINVLLLVTVMGLLGMVVSLIALSKFWRLGLVNVKTGLVGLVLACTMLIPLGFSIVGAIRYPPLNDISTNYEQPPAIIIGLHQVDGPKPNLESVQRDAYPGVQHRFYHSNLDSIYRIAVLTAVEMGWEVVFDRSKVEVENLAWFQATEKSVVFGFSDDIAVRLQSILEGTRLDIRSRSRFGRYDFGANATRIKLFLANLEENLRRNGLSS